MASKSALRELCEQVVDCPHSTPVWTECGVVVLRNQNIRGGRLDLSQPSFTDEVHFADRTRRATPQEGDLVITREAPMGEVCMIPRGLRCCLGQRMVLLRPNKNAVDGRYLLYALQSREVQHEIGVNEGTGSTVSNLRIPVLEALPIPTPDIRQQRAVAHVLGTLDDKIELNRRMNETLETIARAIFKSWFVDFDPVRAKAEGRDTGLPKQIADLFPKNLGDDGTPNGWTTVHLTDLIDVNPPRSLRKGEVAPYLDMANMPTRGHMPDAWIDREFGSGMRFINGDTLVARITPCLENGKTAFVTFLPEGQTAWGSTEFIVLRPKNPIPNVFAYCLARSEEFRQFAIQKMTGSSGRQRVPSESLSRFAIVKPQDEVFEAFGRLVEPLFARATANAMSSRTLAAIRDALLPKLLSGEIRVHDARQLREARA